MTASSLDIKPFSEMAHLTPKQVEAYRLAHRCKFLLYGGAMGGGKSYWLRWALIGLLMELWGRYHVYGVRAMLGCETYVALADRHLAKVALEVPTWLATYHKGEKELRAHPRFGGWVLCFRNLADPSQYQSAEFPLIAIDELTKNDKAVFDWLALTRMRWPGLPDEACRFLAGSNPGGIGHAWVSETWPVRSQTACLKADDPAYGFVPARAADNPHLSPGYMQTLERLPEQLRKAFLEGSWDVFAGQYFREWTPSVHCIPPRALPRQWTRFVSIDYGYSPDYAAVLWFAVDEQDGGLICYRELYVQEQSPADLTKAILAMTPRDEPLTYAVGGHDLFATNAQTGFSNASVMAAHGLPIQPAFTDRMAGWRTVRDYLRVIDKWQGTDLVPWSRLRIFDGLCPNLVRTLPTLVHDDKKVEDVAQGGEDHCADALRYGVCSRPAVETVATAYNPEAERTKRLNREFPRWRRAQEAAGERSAGW